MKDYIPGSHLTMIVVLAMLGAGFATLVHVGSTKRHLRGIEYGFGSRKAPAAREEAGLWNDFRRGTEYIFDQAGAMAGRVFKKKGGAGDGPGAAPPERPDLIPGYEDFLAELETAPPDIVIDGRGRTSGRSEKAEKPAGADGSGPRGSSAGGAAAKAGEARAAGEAAGAAAPSGYSGSVTARRGAGPARPPAAEPAAGPSGAPSAYSSGGGGKTSFRSAAAPESLETASERYRSGSGAAYAAAIAGAFPAAAKDVPAPAAASPAGRARGNRGDAARAAPAPAAGPAAVTEPAPAAGQDPPAATEKPKPPAPPPGGGGDFLDTIAKERAGGEWTAFLPEHIQGLPLKQEELAPGQLLPILKLKEGKDDPLTSGLVVRAPDPPSFQNLSDKHKDEVKRGLHLFLRRVENTYGPMETVDYIPCSPEDAVCGRHKLTEGYVAMRLSGGASVRVAVKYSKFRWLPYLVSLEKP